MRLVSAGLTNAAERKRRFLFVDFLVRMWLLFARILLIFPFPVRRIRLAAPRLVFIFGISMVLLGPVGLGYIYLIGARTIDMIRPSKLGRDSTFPTSLRSSVTRSSTTRPNSGWVTCLPRNIMVNLTLLPSSRNRRAWRVLKS